MACPTKLIGYIGTHNQLDLDLYTLLMNKIAYNIISFFMYGIALFCGISPGVVLYKVFNFPFWISLLLMGIFFHLLIRSNTFDGILYFFADVLGISEEKRMKLG